MIAAEGMRLFQQGKQDTFDLSPDVRLKAYDSVSLL
jgi:hypothetical protein